MDIKPIIDSALKVLREGGVILYPTDTIWGLGCDATNPDAVARIFKIKNRPEAKSLVLLAADLDMVARYVKVIPNIAIDLVEVNDRPMTIIYPGAITSDVPDRHYIAHNAVAEDGSVGIRIPMNEFCVELARKLGRPIVSTSANFSGEPSPQVYADIAQEIRDAVDYIVPQKLERDATGFASQIIKVEVDGQVQIIRP
ncbi:MAG: threonylcarbamoyl-AMP synthase [Bacteroidales bacterium]|nr:threonylcarbamoyl-AMP synthase [Bacteroidales bacterium]